MYVKVGREYVIPISSLTPDEGYSSSHCRVVGVVIHAEKPRSLNVKYATTPATKRYVFNFTLKDEHGDSINVSCWGTVEYVNPISAICFIGAAVEVSNPRIQPIENNQIYLPEVTSSLRLDCDEKFSSAVTSLTDVDDELDEALHSAFRTPLKSSKGHKTSIMDIVREDSIYPEGTLVNVAAVVAEVNPVVEYSGKDRHWHRQEIKLVDHTSKNRYLALVLWETFTQEFAKKWIPCKTVLHISCAKIGHEKQTNRRIIFLTHRSIVTCDPLNEEGHHLARFVDQLSANPTLISEALQSEEHKPLFNRNTAIKVATVAALHQFICRLSPGGREQALLTCYVTNLSLHRSIITKCVHCGKRTGIYDESQALSPACLTDACRIQRSKHEFHFDIGISVSDSSGMVKLLRLRDKAAVRILQLEPEKMLAMSDQERKMLEDRFWLERCEVGVLVECRSNGSRTADVLHMQPLVH